LTHLKHVQEFLLL